MEELNKKLAEWAEFEDIRGRETLAQPTEVGSPRLWGLSKGIYLPIDFTQSLDACFKWLVPKLQDKGRVIDLIVYEHKGFGCMATSIIDNKTLVVTRDDSPALALCKAIEKLIDGEKDVN